MHVCVDDATRLAYAEVLADEKAPTAAGFLRRAVAFFAAHGITVERVITDNGSAYRSTRPRASPAARSGIRHLRTRPYRPQTNGKACVLAFGVPSGGAARLPAPGGLTQAKGMSRGMGVRPDRARLLGAVADLRSICRPSGCGRAGEADLIGDSRRCGCIDTEASLAGPASTLTHEPGGHLVRRDRRPQAHPRRRADRSSAAARSRR